MLIDTRTETPRAVEAPSEPEAIAGLSPMQSGMLYHTLLSEETSPYVQQILVHWRAPLDLKALGKAWEILLARHDILRASFRISGGDEPRQVFQARAALPMQTLDWAAETASARAAHLAEWLARDRAREIPLDAAPLMRWTSIRLGPEEYYLVWTSHHVIMDGRARQLLLRELLSLHDRIHAGERPAPSPAPSYVEYISWLETLDAAAAERHWRTLLRGFTAPTPLPLQDRNSMSPQSRDSHRECSEGLGIARTTALREFADANGVTLNTLVQGAWAMLLSRYTGELDVVFGATRACRRSAANGIAEKMAGLFINTLPVRVKLSPEACVIDWLRELRAQSYEIRPYEHTSLAKVREWSEAPVGAPLFNTIVVFEGYDLQEWLAAQDPRWARSEIKLFDTTNYPLNLSATAGKELVLKLEYDPARFEEAACRRMLTHLVTLLDGMREHPEAQLRELRMLSAVEYDRVVHGWNRTEVDWSAEGDVVARVEQFARRRPDAIAVEAGAAELTYAELNQRANRLAHVLRGIGAGRDVPIGVFLERSINLAVALLGVFKAGSGYVPLDPAYPMERLRHMIESAGMPIILTTRELRSMLPETSARFVELDAPTSLFEEASSENPPLAPADDALAYLMFTSGSTGTPKGVMITREGLKNHNLAVQQAFGLTPRDRVLQFSTICFDIAVEEIFPTWLAGAAVVFRSEAMAFSAADFSRGVAEKGITILDLPTSFWKEWVYASVEQGLSLPPSVRLVIVGGEKTTIESYAAWQRWAPERVRWINTYGPTECTVVATLYEPARSGVVEGEIPIGRPLPNTTLYILDPFGQPVPPGVEGELYIGGAQVAGGYQNDSERTAARFLEDPFSERPGARLYRTGDMVRYRADGEVEFRGRRDSQLKIGGFRVEPAEVEGALRRLPGVEDGVVTVHTTVGGGKRLLGYVKRQAGAPALSADELRERLRADLPGYMVPDSLTILDQFPHTPNGKIDHRALPMPGTRGAPQAEGGRTPYERQLQEIWQELFDAPFIGREANFFHLGGSSLLALRFAARFETAFGKRLPLPLFFRTPTIAALGEFLEAGREKAVSCLVPLQSEGGNAPFFCVHGAGGSSYWFNDLAVLVGRKQPFYGIESPALSAGVTGAELDEMVAIPRLAARYVEEIRRVQPTGPYRLGGYSLGGLIAYEMARQLDAAGERVSLLAIIDANSPGAMLSKGKQLATFVWRFLALGWEEKRRFVSEKWTWLRQLRAERDVEREAGEAVSQLELVKQAHQRSAFVYRPEIDPPYPGRILLFRASQPNLTSPLAHDRGWSDFTSRWVKVVTIPGNHYTLFTPENLRLLADHLRTALSAEDEEGRR
ncbi:MAG: amino acid adenylation domain-containing protein [Blastocatellia bacterium]|nr:amino acid adenylation domain-containing protein [Blastocatellia bacterium]